MADSGQDIERAKRLLMEGELVAVPTETVYGLAANALDAAAVTKIFVAKDRPTFDPLIVHVPSEGQLHSYVEDVPPVAIKMIEHFWPGPLTLVLRKKKIIPDIVTSGLETVGIRCPDHHLTRQLLNVLDFPLAAPSANPFGYVSPTTAAHVNEQLGKKIAYILDGGPCRLGIESTIVGFEDGQPVIYRRGGISQEAIEGVAGKTKTKLHTGANPLAPGQLDSHYSPKKKLLLGDINQLIGSVAPARVGILRFRKGEQTFPGELYLSENGDLAEAARNLFAHLRRLDEEFEIILAERVPDVGIGKAINDRLTRAAAK